MKFYSRLKIYFTRPKKLTAYERIQAQAKEREKVHARADVIHDKVLAFANQAIDLELNDIAQVFLDIGTKLSNARRAVLPELEILATADREDRPTQADKTAEKVDALRRCVESAEAELKTIPPPGKLRRTNAVDDGRLVRANFRPKPQ